MMIEKLSPSAQNVLEKACRLAVRKNHAYVSHWHLLHVFQADSLGFTASTGVISSTLALKIDLQLAGQDKALRDAQHTPISRDLEALLIRSEDIAAEKSVSKIGLSHLQLAMLEREDVVTLLQDSGGEASLLTESALRLDQFERQPVLNTVDSVSSDTEGSFVEKYTRNLTELAIEGKLDPVIGRDEEVRLAIQILCRRIKNNPILLGEPGVGKTAVVEGLAQHIAAGNVPDNLKEAPILSLDMGQLIAGAKYRGEFEERLKGLVDEVHGIPKAILFIDEIHTLIGAGKGEGSMDAANLLKPALSRGQLTCIGATTLDEYRMYFEKDDALMRRFQTVQVPEPTADETMTILRGLEEKYEQHHGVLITDEALQAAVTLSRRYITDRYLPDKAIDLIDQTAASVRIRLSSKPEELDSIDRRLIALEIEWRAIKNENNAQRNRELEGQIAELKSQSDRLTEAWERKRLGMSKIRDAYQTLDLARKQLDESIKTEDFSRVAELQYKVIPSAEKIISEFSDVEQFKSDNSESSVFASDIAQTVEKLTGIPVNKLLDSEKERLINLEDALRKRVVGQDEAATAIAKAIRRAKADLQDTNRPQGSFLMLGPSGVGKTEISKALAEFLFTDESSILRFDMSEYMEKHAVSRLTGAPPGYVGYEEGGVLTNRVRHKPYSVVLFDEVEKAHPDVFNIFLQMLDDGRLTDSQGHVVSFVNTIILLTSNLGSQFIHPVSTPEEEIEMQANIMEAVRGHFRPEFLNRLDEVLIFKQLSLETMRPIVDIQLRRLVQRLSEKTIELEVSDEARDLLATWGFDPNYGARPLKRVIQSRLQDTLSDMLLRGELVEKSTVRVGTNPETNSLTFEVWS